MIRKIAVANILSAITARIEAILRLHVEKKKAIKPERKMPEVKTIRVIFKGERNRVPEIQLPVKLNGARTFDFEVDTGAGDNFLGSKQYMEDLGQPHLTEKH